MKKLLAIVLVLGLAAVANASFVLEKTGTTLQITSSGNTDGSLYFAIKGAVSGGVVGGNVTTDATFTGWGPDADYLALLGGAQGISGWLSVGMAAGGFTDGAVLKSIVWDGKKADFYVMNEAGQGVFVNSVVPEPITMTLLGLGGLVALRRRMA